MWLAAIQSQIRPSLQTKFIESLEDIKICTISNTNFGRSSWQSTGDYRFSRMQIYSNAGREYFKYPRTHRLAIICGKSWFSGPRWPKGSARRASRGSVDLVTSVQMPNLFVLLLNALCSHSASNAFLYRLSTSTNWQCSVGQCERLTIRTSEWLSVET